MATQHVMSCAVALENNTYSATDAGGFGNINPLTGRPTAASVGASPALSYKVMEMTREGLTTWGDSQINLREDETRAGAYLPVPEPVSMQDCSTGVLYEHRMGDITLDIHLPGIGDATEYSLNEEMPWVQIFRSGMAYTTNANDPDVLTAGSTQTVLSAAVGGGVKYEVGQMIAVDQLGQREVSWVTGITVDAITISPGLRVAPAAGVIVRFCDNLYLANDPNADVGDSVSLRLNTYDGITYAFGCRLASFNINVEEKLVKATLVLRAAHIEEDRSAPTVPAVDESDGELPHFIGSFGKYTDNHTGTAAPFGLAGNIMSVDTDTVSINLENILAETGYSGDLLSSSDWEVADSMATMEFTLGTPVTALDTWLNGRETRMVTFGFGPCGLGNGFGVQMGGANATASTSKRNPENDLMRQPFQLRAGIFNGDDDSTAGTNTPFRIGIVNGVPVP